MTKVVEIGGRPVGQGHPVYVIGEIGINHNGDVGIAKRLIDAAKVAGCEAVKFQKRTPELCVPLEQRNLMRETPWGIMTYMDYRVRTEFGDEEYGEIDRYCRERGIHWFASCWDEPSVDFIEKFEPVCYKLASASITNDGLVTKVSRTGRPVIISSGMSTMEEVRHAVSLLQSKKTLLAHTTSTYPCPTEEVNLRMMLTLAAEFDCPVGYSGHEVGLQVSLVATALGGTFLERHITLDRAMWGSDQAASVEPHGLVRLIRDIRVVEAAMGDGIKRVYESEMPSRKKLRGS